MPKVISYQLEFNPEISMGVIKFYLEGTSTLYELKRLSSSDFTALSTMLATGHVNASGHSFFVTWNESPRSEAPSILESEDDSFEVPEKYK